VGGAVRRRRPRAHRAVPAGRPDLRARGGGGARRGGRTRAADARPHERADVRGRAALPRHHRADVGPGAPVRRGGARRPAPVVGPGGGRPQRGVRPRVPAPRVRRGAGAVPAPGHARHAARGPPAVRVPQERPPGRRPRARRRAVPAAPRARRRADLLARAARDARAVRPRPHRHRARPRRAGRRARPQLAAAHGAAAAPARRLRAAPQRDHRLPVDLGSGRRPGPAGGLDLVPAPARASKASATSASPSGCSAWIGSGTWRAGTARSRRRRTPSAGASDVRIVHVCRTAPPAVGGLEARGRRAHAPPRGARPPRGPGDSFVPGQTPGGVRRDAPRRGGAWRWSRSPSGCRAALRRRRRDPRARRSTLLLDQVLCPADGPGGGVHPRGLLPHAAARRRSRPCAPNGHAVVAPGARPTGSGTPRRPIRSRYAPAGGRARWSPPASTSSGSLRADPGAPGGPRGRRPGPASTYTRASRTSSPRWRSWGPG
jgi:hypothetical protein